MSSRTQTDEPATPIAAYKKRPTCRPTDLPPASPIAYPTPHNVQHIPEPQQHAPHPPPLHPQSLGAQTAPHEQPNGTEHAWIRQSTASEPGSSRATIPDLSAYVPWPLLVLANSASVDPSLVNALRTEAPVVDDIAQNKQQLICMTSVTVVLRTSTSKTGHSPSHP